MKKYILGFLFIAFVFLTNASSAFADTQNYYYERELSHGSSGNAVVLLEFCLARIYDVHYNNDTYYNIDGYFGKRTKYLVRDFQKRNNLHVDGILGPHTANKISELCVNNYSASLEKVRISNIQSKNKKSNSLVRTKINLSKDKTKATIIYSFRLTNTFDTHLDIDTQKDFIFRLNNQNMNALMMNKKSGFRASFYDQNKKQITDATVLLPRQSQYFYIHLDIDTGIIPSIQDVYSIQLKQFNWEMKRIHQVLNFDTSPELVSIKKIAS